MPVVSLPRITTVAILMTGGPGTVFGPRAFAAFREFQEQKTTAA